MDHQMDEGFPNRLRKSADDMRRGLPADGVPMALDVAADEIDALREMIGALIAEPRRSVKLISKKMDQFEPLRMTVTKGQVLEALKLIRP